MYWRASRSTSSPPRTGSAQDTTSGCRSAAAPPPRLVLNPGTGDPLATSTELRPADQEIFHYRCQTRAI